MEKKVFVSDVNGRRDRELELELSDARWSESTSSQRHEFIQHPDCLSLSTVFCLMFVLGCLLWHFIDLLVIAQMVSINRCISSK